MTNRDVLQYLELPLIKGTFSEQKNFITKAREMCKSKLDYYIKSNLERNKLKRANALKEELQNLIQ